MSEPLSAAPLGRQQHVAWHLAYSKCSIKPSAADVVSSYASPGLRLWLETALLSSLNCPLEPAVQTKVWGPAAAASPGNSSEMLNLRPHPRPTESDSALPQDSQVSHMGTNVCICEAV